MNAETSLATVRNAHGFLRLKIAAQLMTEFAEMFLALVKNARAVLVARFVLKDQVVKCVQKDLLGKFVEQIPAVSRDVKLLVVVNLVKQ